MNNSDWAFLQHHHLININIIHVDYIKPAFRKLGFLLTCPATYRKLNVDFTGVILPDFASSAYIFLFLFVQIASWYLYYSSASVSND